MSYCISFFYKGVLINSETMISDSVELLEDKANETILTIMKKQIPLKSQITAYKQTLQKTIDKTRNREFVSRFNRRLSSIAIFTLMKLQRLDNDNKNGYIITKNKKKIKKIDPGWLKLRF
jgi:hypothetical protein|tara:strand:- start:52 stop:411 length:360 start_codon:yes stop_codon:yes gene_type:complete